MRGAMVVLVFAVAVCFSRPAAAQLNFQLFPVFGSIEGPAIVYGAWVISYRDGKLYHCRATTKQDTAPTLQCRAQGAYKPPLLPGGNVITAQILGLAPADNTAALAPYFWQIDEGTGQIQFCEAPDAVPQAKSCVASQIP